MTMKTKAVLIVFFLCYSFKMFAQNSKEITLEVPMHKASFYSFFKNKTLENFDPIKRIIPGNNNLNIYSDTENNDHILRLQIEDSASFIETNLVVITESGAFYTFNVIYNEDSLLYENFFPSKAHYQKPVQEKETIDAPINIIGNDNDSFAYFEHDRNESSKIDSTVMHEAKTKLKQGLYFSDRNEYYKKYCANTIATKKNKYKRIFSVNKNRDVVLRLHSIEYNRDELYFFFEIENNSPTDYIVRDKTLNFLIEFKKSDIQSSIDEISPKVSYVYFPPNRIKTKQSTYCVWVVKNFSIEKRKQLNVGMNEKNGERNINLVLDYRMINEPK